MYPLAAQREGELVVLHEGDVGEHTRLEEQASLDEHALIAVGDSTKYHPRIRGCLAKRQHGGGPVEADAEAAEAVVRHNAPYLFERAVRQHAVAVQKEQDVARTAQGAFVQLATPSFFAGDEGERPLYKGGGSVGASTVDEDDIAFVQQGAQLLLQSLHGAGFVEHGHYDGYAS